MTITEALSGTIDPGPPAVRLDGVSRIYPGGTHALDRVDVAIEPGQFLCLVGASGCGKSTLLNLLAKLDQPSQGTVTVEGSAALMFQDHALMPWLTAEDNVALPLRLAGVGRKERLEKARELLSSVHLADVASKRPHELSGGMRQRVAIARTLATGAPILLMDEPFAALDAITRDLLHDELESIYLERGLTVVFVTHNVREAVRLADRVVLLSSRPGRVVHDYRIDLPRPRRSDGPGVAEITVEITTALRKEVARHAG